VVLLPEHVVPTPTTIQAPSKLPPPPPPPRLDEDLRGSSSELLGRAERSGDVDRGSEREPESDFSSLPILPPALPDCAKPELGVIASISRVQSRAAVSRETITFGMAINFQINKGCAITGRSRRRTRHR